MFNILSLEGVDDLLQLGDFNEGALLHTIRVRHNLKQIYTSIGTPILIAVNPYKKLSLYSTTIAKEYREWSRSRVVQRNSADTRPEPHLFMVAEESYQDMLNDKKD